MKVIFSTVVAEVFCSESRWLLRTDQGDYDEIQWNVLVRQAGNN